VNVGYLDPYIALHYNIRYYSHYFHFLSFLLSSPLEIIFRKCKVGYRHISPHSVFHIYFFGYDFSFLNQNNGKDCTGTDVGVITNTYKMNICGSVNDGACQYSWRLSTSVCYICTRGNPHVLGSVTLIGLLGRMVLA
jgi:hypothetical protein